MPEPAELHGRALDFLRAGDNYRAPYAAAFRYQPAAWLDHLRLPAFIGARQDDMLLPHLERLGEVPGNVRLEQLSDDHHSWGTRLWAQLNQGVQGLAPAPEPVQAPLPAGRIANAYLDGDQGRLHVRGALGGTGCPLVLLHDSPGGARGLDPRAQAVLGQRPVLAPDLPAHGDSAHIAGAKTTRGVAAALHGAFQKIGLEEAELEGFGIGMCVAAALAKLQPGRYTTGPGRVGSPGSVVPPYHAPRADGGHIFGAWFQARDEAILGPWSARNPSVQHDFGDDLNLENIHVRTIDILKESSEAAPMRWEWLAEWTSAQRP